MTHELETYGLILLFALVAIEGCGIPLPGETALATAAVLAADGHFLIEAVIAIAALGAIVGDNTGYLIGRHGGRALLRRIPVVRESSERFLPRAERFFASHGAKTVVIARFVLVLRTTAAFLAGVSHMPWRRFFLFNAAGGILWATTIGVVAYVFGRAAVNAVSHYGVYAVVALVAVALAALAAHHVWHKRMSDRLPTKTGKSATD